MERTTIELADGVEATIDIEEDTSSGGPVVRSIAITAPEGSRGVTGEHLRALRLVDVLRDHRESEPAGAEFVEQYAALADEWRRVVARPKSGRWATLTDDELARYAEAYLEAYAERPRSPVELMSTRSRESIAKTRDRLKACRAFGWLVGTTHGRAGAHPGPLLVEYRLAHGADPSKHLPATAPRRRPPGSHRSDAGLLDILGKESGKTGKAEER